MKLYIDDIRNPHQSGYKDSEWIVCKNDKTFIGYSLYDEDDEPKLYYIEWCDLWEIQSNTRLIITQMLQC